MLSLSVSAFLVNDMIRGLHVFMDDAIDFLVRDAYNFTSKKTIEREATAHNVKDWSETPRHSLSPHAGVYKTITKYYVL